MTLRPDPAAAQERRDGEIHESAPPTLSAFHNASTSFGADPDSGSICQHVSADPPVAGIYWPRATHTPVEHELRRVYDTAKSLAEQLEIAELWELRYMALQIRERAFLELLLLAGVEEVVPDPA